MTFIEIFEHILYGHEFDTQKVENLIEKAETTVTKVIDKALDII